MGNFARYRGHNLREIGSGKRGLRFQTDDPKTAAELGFEEHGPGDFRGWIPPEDLEYGWTEDLYALYEGSEFWVRIEKPDVYVLETDDYDLAKKLDFEAIELGVNLKTVKRSEVTSVRKHITMYLWRGDRWEQV